ncbi:peptidyl-prolyl cis-trans isomerase NIMA-interacting 4 [Microdochium nivale]|nr:peptidyl-prolyl cis-trans isomerase NIMA-interacting 4 [Microdochium nivale]
MGATKKDGKADNQKPAKLKGGQSIDVRHILCKKMSKKEEALAKINENPSLANFIEIAMVYDEDKPKAGGALGWKTKGELDSAFEAVAYTLEPSSESKFSYGEAKTEYGYHIIVVEGRK